MQTRTQFRSITLEPFKDEKPPSFFTPDRLFLLAIAGAIIVTGYFVTKVLQFNSLPFEDAAMLMRYAIHIAQGNGITWNIGASPVDGGTDFLFMVILAGLVKVGLSVEISVRIIGIVSHLLTVLIVYYTIVKLHKCSRWAGLLSATYLAIGPALAYIAAYFGTPLFALFACLTWYCANKLIATDTGNRSRIMPFLFALSGLTLGLIRPEGVILATFMLCAVVYMQGLKPSVGVVATFLAVFLSLGGTYFLWRWHYFGYPLPNPFYKKGGGHLYMSSLIDSVKMVIHLCGPFTLAIIAGFRSRKTLKPTVFLLIPTLGFTVIWVLLSNEMNFAGRFQYAILPIVCMSWPVLLKDITQDFRLPRLTFFNRRTKLILFAIIGGLCLVLASYQSSIDTQDAYYHDGKYDVATMLQEYSNKGYTMATTEAGLLPFYSQWNDIDTWGLNDQWIAHNGQITPAYLDRYKPELIMFHASFSPIVPITTPTDVEPWLVNWFPMVMTLKRYAESHHYILAADFGVSPYDTYYYYVRSDFPDSAAIVSKIQHIHYYSFTTGELCVNYALIPPNQ